MTTNGATMSKVQEIELLAKIAKMIPAGSYLAVAFEEYQTITKQNIEDDAARTYTDALRNQREANHRLQEHNDELQRTVDALKRDVAHIDQLLQYQKGTTTQYGQLLQDAKQQLQEAKQQAAQNGQELAAKDLDVIKLKARLFDLIEKQK